MLTKKQRELLLYIRDHLARTGVSPSFDEMKDALNLKSKSGIHRLITALEERGFIRRLAHRARAVEILRLPEDFSGLPTGKTGAEKVSSSADEPAGGLFRVPQTPHGTPANQSVPEATGESENVQVPLFGKIAAGTPIDALSDPSTFVDIPLGTLAGGEHYALTVEGDSMIEAGILDGDTVVIQRCDVVENGHIGVALVDNEEATLKRVNRKGGKVELEPANRHYQTQVYAPDRVKIQGRLIALLRHY